MKLLTEVLEDFENRIKRIETYIEMNETYIGFEEQENCMSYGLVKSYEDYDLYYERITDTIDGFVIRNQYGSIVRIYPETKETLI